MITAEAPLMDIVAIAVGGQFPSCAVKMLTKLMSISTVASSSEGLEYD